MNLDDQICYCYHVSLRKLVNYARRERPMRASQMSDCLGAGTGCGWCIPILKRIHESIREEASRHESGGAGEPGEKIGDIPHGLPASAEEYAEQRKGYIRESRTKNTFD